MPKLKSVMRLIATAALATVTFAPAFAHPGNHHGMSFGELASHLSSGWHLALVIAAGAASIALVYLGVRRQGRARRSHPRRPS